MLRPYRPRNATGGTRQGSISQFQEIFNFKNCDVAKYLIAQNGDNLQYKNGRPTELYKHAANCERCNSKIVESQKSLSTIEFHDKEILKRFRQWVKLNHPTETDESAIKILIDYYNFAYSIMRPEWVAYKQRYGDLKK